MAFPWLLAANIGVQALPAVASLFGKTSDPYGPYAQGGAYGPERMMELFSPRRFAVQAPSAAAGLPYGQAALGLAASGARLSSGAAVNTLPVTMNPSARIAALGQIAQSAAAGVGGAGVAGYQSGLDEILRARAMTASNALQATGAYSGTLDRAMEAGAFADQLRRARLEGLFGSLGKIGGTALDWYQNRPQQPQQRTHVW